MEQETETFWTLLRNAAHWEFEVFLMFVFDIVIGLMILPYLRRLLKRHKGDDDKIACLQRRLNYLQAKLDIKDGCEHNGCNHTK